MSRHILSNPEIRLVSDPQIAVSSNNERYSQIGHLDILADIPGFSSSMFHVPFTPTSTEPYQSKVETFSSAPLTMTSATPTYPAYQSKGESTFSSTPRTKTPATPVYPPYQTTKVETFSSATRTTTPSTPLYPSVDPAVKEEHSPKAATNSPMSPAPKELPIQADFRPRTKQQRKYDKRFKGQGEPIPSDFLKE